MIFTHNSQVGFINNYGKWAPPGMGDCISPAPEGSPYRVGKCVVFPSADEVSVCGFQAIRVAAIEYIRIDYGDED